MTSHAKSTSVTLPIARERPFDPPADLGRFRETDPLRRLEYPDGHLGWLVTSYVLARAVLSDTRFGHRLEDIRLPTDWPAADEVYGKPTPPGFFLHMDPPEHTRFRRLLIGEFSSKRIASLEPKIERLVQSHLDDMEHIGSPVDLMEAFAWPIPSLTICELLGVPYSDHAEFHRLNQLLTSHDSSSVDGAEAWASLTQFFGDLIRHKKNHPTDDLLSNLATGGELTDDEVAGVGFLLHRAGHETTASMLGLGTYVLLCRPEQLALLREGVASIKDAVEELLRYLTILQFGVQRTALEDVELGGETIAGGESVTVSLPAANRDPKKFHEPDKLDLARGALGHLAFGYGFHQCIGQQLARAELVLGFRGLLTRFPTLQLAVGREEVALADRMGFYGVRQLPVRW